MSPPSGKRPYRLFSALPDHWSADADGIQVEIRRDRWGLLCITLFRGVNPKTLDLTSAQAAAIRDGLAATLGD